MEVKKVRVKKILSSGKDVYEVPYFQRSYVWDKPNWDAWIDTLLDLQNQDEESSVFIGSIILKIVDQGRLGRVNRFSIIDGQQRLTTIMVFLKACVDHNEILKDDFNEYISTKELGKPIQKLKNNHQDSKIFQEILKSASPVDMQSDITDIIQYVWKLKRTTKRIS
ncbi:MAG: DUF262 domain-containing protein [Spirochaetota bacterium]|nr:DUF262 domain-containing protein [Spirochaetota bacterium]